MIKITKERVSEWILDKVHRLSNRQMMAVLAVVVGLLAGLGTCLFEMLLYGVRSALVTWFPVDRAQFLYLIYPAIGIVLATLFVKYIVKDEISEGVTRVLYAMSRKDSRIARHNCWSSIVGGATTIGFGGSVGPEAPIVLTGAAIGSNVGKLAKLNYKELTLLLCCGAGAAESGECAAGVECASDRKEAPVAGLRPCQLRADGVSVPQEAGGHALFHCRYPEGLPRHVRRCGICGGRCHPQRPRIPV